MTEKSAIYVIIAFALSFDKKSDFRYDESAYKYSNLCFSDSTKNAQ